MNRTFKLFFLIAAFFTCTSAFAQTDTLGQFNTHMDIGKPKNAGASQYDKVTHTYTMKGSGYNIWFNRDEFQYLFKKIKGDFTATANFQFLGATGNGHRKIGWMIRESTDDKSIHVSAVEHGDGLTVLQWRAITGENMKDPQEEIFFPEKTFEVVQLQRIGKKLIMRVGHVGESLKAVGATELDNMPDEALVGLFICSHDPEVTEQAKIWDVHIDIPAK
jgi:regulation of enolase protein 1 (concanavalin A-like superfamily)